SRKHALAAELRGLPVLGVDDNATCRQLLQDQLTAWGFNSQTVGDGDGALALLRAAAAAGTPFRLAITDLQMPGMSGEELAQVIKSGPELANTVLIGLSYLGDPIDATLL